MMLPGLGLAVAAAAASVSTPRLAAALLFAGLCAAYFAVLRHRSGPLEVTDLRLWLGGLFFLYGIVVPVVGPQVVAFDDEVVFQATLINCVAAAGLLAGLLVSRPAGAAPSRAHADFDARTLDAAWLAALVALVAGYAMVVLQYRSLGGLGVIAAVNRGVRKDLLQASTGLPFAPAFALFVTMACVRLAFARRAAVTLFVVVNMAVIAGFYVITGERDSLLQLGLAALVGLSARRRLALTGRAVAVVVLCAVALQFLGPVRAVVPGVLSGRVSPTDALTEVNWARAFAPGELEAPFLALLQVVDARRDPRFTYPAALAGPVPEAIYPGEKPTPIHRDIAEELELRRGRGSRVVGRGMLPAAEAYLNAGVAGVFVVFLAFGAAVSAVSRRLATRRSLLLVGLYGVLALTVQTANRSPLVSVVTELAHGAVLTAVFVGGALLIRNARRQPSRQARGVELVPA